MLLQLGTHRARLFTQKKIMAIDARIEPTNRALFRKEGALDCVGRPGKHDDVYRSCVEQIDAVDKRLFNRLANILNTSEGSQQTLPLMQGDCESRQKNWLRQTRDPAENIEINTVLYLGSFASSCL